MTTTQENQLSRESVAKTLALDRPVTRWARLKRWLRWILPLAVVVAGAAVWASGRGATPVQYLTEPAKRGDLRLHVTATGNLQPTNEVEVGSELSGILKTVEVDSDDVVHVGQVLARLDPTKLGAQALQSEALVNSARAKLRQTQATTEESRSQLARLERVRELSGGKVPSEQDLEAARATLKRAEADEASRRGRCGPGPGDPGRQPHGYCRSWSSARPSTASSSRDPSSRARPWPRPSTRRCCSRWPRTSPRWSCS